MKRSLAFLLVALLLASITPGASARGRWWGNAPYSVDVQTLDAALDCSTQMTGYDVDEQKEIDSLGPGKLEPVLLVHGTYVNRRTNFEWNYWRSLPQLGLDVCWVELPSGAENDAQISSEYVARAVEVMAKRSGEQVDVLGHSQGALLPRWAIRYFPSARFVDDYIGLASPSHGTQFANTVRDLVGVCHESCWQMAQGSNFLAAVNSRDETPGPIDYTSIYTQFDEVVFPPETSAIEGATNVMLQDLCPGRPVDHLGIVGDGLTYLLVEDALLNDGPADPDRLPATACTEGLAPDTTAMEPAAFLRDDSSTLVDEEPPLRPYALKAR